MIGDFFSRAGLTFANSRAEALQRLQEFVPVAGRYARDRNKMMPGHPNVSRLSPAIRHRLITEDECCAAPLKRYAPSTVEKFVQEISWRRYWKSWLSLRPRVWSAYLSTLAGLRSEAEFEKTRIRATQCETGQSPIDLMNYFAQELVETGYLHNHARMWFAGWWVHVERLPWQLGADFFFRHLLDADPASNTLSWRWVAGLQTPGKCYLPRRGNIEKYVDPELLDGRTGGLQLLERPIAFRPTVPLNHEVTQLTLPEEPALGGGRVGIWIHDEDLLPEQSPLATLHPTAVLVAGNLDGWRGLGFPRRKQDWLREALVDARARADRHFGISSTLETKRSLGESLLEWAHRHGLQQIAAIRPQVGPLADVLPSLRASLAASRVQLVLLDRPEDTALRRFATGGFFTFWKQCLSAGAISSAS